MIQLRALAYSQTAPRALGNATCTGVYSKAINLLTANHQLLTLHCYPHGISPMGWLLRQDDFYLLSEHIGAESQITLTDSALIVDNVLIQRAGHPLSLDLHANHHPLSALSLQWYLHHVDKETGLFGSLSQIVDSPLPDQLGQFSELFCSALTGGEADWSPFIGLGPGLTPSGDDMLVGLMAAAFSYEPLAQRLRTQSLIDDSIPLKDLTTQVSYTYLDYANKGYFATPLLSVVKALQSGKKEHLAIAQLLMHGHTSGADTLLGLWLGASVVARLRLF